jgi:hypothetical protein
MDDLRVLGERRRAAREAFEEADQAFREAVVGFVPAQVSESEAARLGGVDRMTVRKILGKR